MVSIEGINCLDLNYIYMGSCLTNLFLLEQIDLSTSVFQSCLMIFNFIAFHFPSTNDSSKVTIVETTMLIQRWSVEE